LPHRAWHNKNRQFIGCNPVAIANKKQIVFLTGQQWFYKLSTNEIIKLNNLDDFDDKIINS